MSYNSDILASMVNLGRITSGWPRLLGYIDDTVEPIYLANGGDVLIYTFDEVLADFNADDISRARLRIWYQNDASNSLLVDSVPPDVDIYGNGGVSVVDSNGANLIKILIRNDGKSQYAKVRLDIPNNVKSNPSGEAFVIYVDPRRRDQVIGTTL